MEEISSMGASSDTSSSATGERSKSFFTEGSETSMLSTSSKVSSSGKRAASTASFPRRVLMSGAGFAVFSGFAGFFFSGANMERGSLSFTGSGSSSGSGSRSNSGSGSGAGFFGARRASRSRSSMGISFGASGSGSGSGVSKSLKSRSARSMSMEGARRSDMSRLSCFGALFAPELSLSSDSPEPVMSEKSFASRSLSRSAASA